MSFLPFIRPTLHDHLLRALRKRPSVCSLQLFVQPACISAEPYKCETLPAKTWKLIFFLSTVYSAFNCNKGTDKKL